MNIIALIFLILFISVSILHTFFVFRREKKLQYYSLPSILITLILYDIFSVPFGNINYFIVIGLVCGFIGNFFFIFYHEEEHWLNGVIFLIVGQFSYIIAFLREIKHFEYFIPWKLLLIIPVVIITIIIYLRIRENTDEFHIHVYMYLGVIFFMNLFSILRLPGSLGLSFYLVWVGSLIFQVYYGIILIDMFDQKIPHTGIFVLITYIIAQFLIVQGDILGIFLL